MRLRTAKVISTLSHPVAVFPFTFPIFIAKTNLTGEQIYLLAVIAGLIFLPFLYFFYELKKKKISDWDVTNRRERYPIYVVGIIGGSLAILLLAFFNHPLTFLVAISFYFLALFVTIINFFWKISLHAATITTAVLLFHFLVRSSPYLYFLIPLVCWSRLEEKKHTPGQIIGGVALGAAVVFGVLSFSAN